MLDRLLKSGLRLTIMSLIMVTGAAGLILGYCGLFHLLARHYGTAAAWVAGGIVLGLATLCLVRYGDDLMDR
jgi:hypothetical protein